METEKQYHHELILIDMFFNHWLRWIKLLKRETVFHQKLSIQKFYRLRGNKKFVHPINNERNVEDNDERNKPMQTLTEYNCENDFVGMYANKSNSDMYSIYNIMVYSSIGHMVLLNSFIYYHCSPTSYFSIKPSCHKRYIYK